MPTDKERIDWLATHSLAKIEAVYWQSVTDEAEDWRITFRAAIDAAMKAERTRTKEEGR